MVAFPVGHYRNRDANEHRRRDQHHDAASQRLNNTLPGTRRLRIAQSAILSEKETRGEEGSDRAEHPGEPPFFSVAIEAHLKFLPASMSLSQQPSSRSTSAEMVSCAAAGSCPTRSCSSSSEQKS